MVYQLRTYGLLVAVAALSACGDGGRGTPPGPDGGRGDEPDASEQPLEPDAGNDAGAPRDGGSDGSVIADGGADAEAPSGLVRVALTVAGNGVIAWGDDEAQRCTVDCELDLEEGSELRLAAWPDEGARFDGWGGAPDCEGASCQLTVQAGMHITARFGARGSVVLRAEGPGCVYDEYGTARACDGAPLDPLYDDRRDLHLVARPDAGARFVRWSGDCTCAERHCALAVDGQLTTVTGVFEQAHEYGQVFGDVNDLVREVAAAPDGSTAVVGTHGDDDGGWLRVSDASGQLRSARELVATGGSDARARLDAAAFAPGGDLVVVGSFEGSLDLGCGAPLRSSEGFEGADDSDIFLASFDVRTAEATCRWQTSWGDEGAQLASVLAMAADGSMILGGTMDHAFTFAGQRLEPVVDAGSYLVKVGADLSELWSYGDSTEVPRRAVALPDGGAVALLSDPELTPDAAVLVRLDEAGQAMWTRRGIGMVGYGDAALAGLTVTPRGEIVVAAGEYVLEYTFTHLRRFDATGALLGSATFDDMLPNDLASDARGDLIFVGNALGVADLGTGALGPLSRRYAVLAKLTADFEPRWDMSFVMESADPFAVLSVAVDGDDHIVLAGRARSALDLGYGTAVPSTGAAFVTRIAP